MRHHLNPHKSTNRPVFVGRFVDLCGRSCYSLLIRRLPHAASRGSVSLARAGPRDCSTIAAPRAKRKLGLCSSRLCTRQFNVSARSRAVVADKRQKMDNCRACAWSHHGLQELRSGTDSAGRCEQFNACRVSRLDPRRARASSPRLELAPGEADDWLSPIIATAGERHRRGFWALEPGAEICCQAQSQRQGASVSAGCVIYCV